jgi:3-hydroxyacyl-[acyl-carrier-protein] dehydratase
MRFSLIDKITQLDAGKSLTAVKNLSLAEEYLADHFPGFPVMPGVLMIESLVQASSWLLRETEQFAYSTILLKQARAVKFNNFVSPGQALTVAVTIHSWKENTCVLQGAGTVDGAPTVSAKLTLERFNLADRNPDLAASDEYEIRKLRELFHVLWTPERGLVT